MIHFLHIYSKQIEKIKKNCRGPPRVPRGLPGPRQKFWMFSIFFEKLCKTWIINGPFQGYFRSISVYFDVFFGAPTGFFAFPMILAKKI